MNDILIKLNRWWGIYVQWILLLFLDKYVRLEKDTVDGTKSFKLEQRITSKVSRFPSKGCIQEFSNPMETSSGRDSKHKTLSCNRSPASSTLRLSKQKISLKEPSHTTSFSILGASCRISYGNTFDPIWKHRVRTCNLCKKFLWNSPRLIISSPFSPSDRHCKLDVGYQEKPITKQKQVREIVYKDLKTIHTWYLIK